jgi:signal peptidase I
MTATLAPPTAAARRRRRRSRARTRVVALLAVLLAVWLLWPATLGGRLGLVVVHGNSMSPTYAAGDVVLTWRAPVEIGVPVLLRVPEGRPFAGLLVIHRIVGTDGDDWLTQGDNSPTPDLWSLDDADILGRAVLRLPGLGAMLRRSADPWVLGALVGAALTSALWPARRAAAPADGSPARPSTPAEPASAPRKARKALR